MIIIANRSKFSSRPDNLPALYIIEIPCRPQNDKSVYEVQGNGTGPRLTEQGPFTDRQLRDII